MRIMKYQILPTMTILVEKFFNIRLEYHIDARFNNKYNTLDTDESVELIKIIKEGYLKTNKDEKYYIRYLGKKGIKVCVNRMSNSTDTWVGVYEEFEAGRNGNIYSYIAGQYIDDKTFDEFIDKSNEAYREYIKNISDFKSF